MPRTRARRAFAPPGSPPEPQSLGLVGSGHVRPDTLALPPGPPGVRGADLPFRRLILPARSRRYAHQIFAMSKRKYDTFVDPTKVTTTISHGKYLLQYKGRLGRSCNRPYSTRYKLFDAQPTAEAALKYKKQFVQKLQGELGGDRRFDSPVAAPPSKEPAATAAPHTSRNPKRDKKRQGETEASEASEK